MAAAHAGVAVVELLRGSAAVRTAVVIEERIVGGELPPGLITAMPTAAVLVSEAGGIRQASPAPIFRARIDVRSYQVSPLLASELSAVVHERLQGQANLVVANTSVLGITLTGGPIPFSEPDLPDWYSTLRSYVVLINEVPFS